MRILSPLTLIIGLGFFWGFQILIPAGKEREMLISVILGMVINLALNFVLIPRYKQNGAAIANVISELAVTMAYMFFCIKVINFKISHKSLFNNILAAVPLIIIIFIYKSFVTNVYYQLFLSIISFGALFLFIQIKVLKNSVINELIVDLMKRR